MVSRIASRRHRLAHPPATDPLAYLGMARSYSLEGKGAESRAAYERFFDLWKGADANPPVLQEARREYTKPAQLIDSALFLQVSAPPPAVAYECGRWSLCGSRDHPGANRSARR